MPGGTDNEADAVEFVDFKCPYCGTELCFPKDATRLAQECLNCLELVIVPQDGQAVGGKLPIPITTPRLVLRRFQPGDWKDVMELLPEVYLPGHRPSDSPIEQQAIRWLEEDARARFAQLGQSLCLAIALQDGGKVVGHVSLSYLGADHRQASLWIYLLSSYQRKGYGTEAIRALLGLCFAGLGLHRVTASSESRNTPVRRLLERVGLRCEGEFVEDSFQNGEWSSTVFFGMLSKEYGP